MTLAVYCGRKTTTQQQIKICQFKVFPATVLLPFLQGKYYSQKVYPYSLVLGPPFPIH